MTQSPSLPELPKLPEPYAVASTMKCVSCGTPYEPTRSLASYATANPFACVPTHACKCGSTTFGSTASYDSPSHAQFTAAHLRDYAIAHGLACYEAGRASRAQSEWQTPPASWRLLAKAAIDLLWAIDTKHDTEKPPTKYAVPYGAVNNFRQALGCAEDPPLAPTQGAEGAAPQAVAAEIRDLLCELGNGVKSSNWRLAERAFDMSAKFLVDQPLAATADPATHDDSDDIAAEKAAQGYPGAES